MSNFANTVKIENFKSIRSLELTDCRRINLFIGKPNVGKSNIMEALSLFSLPYLIDCKYKLKDLIRYDVYNELFFDGDSSKEASVVIDNDRILIKNEQFLDIRIGDLNQVSKIDSSDIAGILILETIRYKNYYFKKLKSGYTYSNYLTPPFGDNLYYVIQLMDKLKTEFLQIFKNYGLNLVFDKASNSLKIMKGVEKGEIFLIPFSSVADSLQRLIFYKTAIRSNENSIITFEEPETHTYPPYIKQIANDIVESKTNQFFLTTHSPYVVSELLTSADDGELAIFLVDFKEGETVTRRLTDTELKEVYNNDIDLFFNSELFL